MTDARSLFFGWPTTHSADTQSGQIPLQKLKFQSQQSRKRISTLYRASFQWQPGGFLAEILPTKPKNGFSRRFCFRPMLKISHRGTRIHTNERRNAVFSSATGLSRWNSSLRNWSFSVDSVPCLQGSQDKSKVLSGCRRHKRFLLRQSIHVIGTPTHFPSS